MGQLVLFQNSQTGTNLAFNIKPSMLMKEYLVTFCEKDNLDECMHEWVSVCLTLSIRDFEICQDQKQTGLDHMENAKSCVR